MDRSRRSKSLRAESETASNVWRMERTMILVLVFVGSILAAAGGLYFIDIKFCKDWFQAMVMLVGGLLMVAGGEIAVTGSSTSYFKAQQVRTSLCELEGEGAHPGDRRGDSERVIFKHIVGCMKSAGYVWTTSHIHCREAPVASNPLCYLPSAAFARMVTSGQTAFE
jgi:hypothetical protein